MPNPLRVILLFLILTFNGGFNAQPASYYFDSVHGSDANSGLAPNAAWQTLKPIASLNLRPGDTLNFARGSSWSGTPVAIKASGTEGNPITLKSYGEGSLPLFKNPGKLNAMTIQGKWIVVDGLAFADTAVFKVFGNDEYIDSGALVILPFADHVTVRNSDFTRVGVGVKTYGQYSSIAHNHFRDLMIAYRDAKQSYGAIGVSVNSSNVEVAYNTFTNCRSTDSPYGADGGAIEIEGWWFPKKDEISIHHNRSTGSQGFLEVTETTTKNVRIFNNISDDYQQFVAWDTTTTPENYQVYHNTVIRTHPEDASNLFAVFQYRVEGPAPQASWVTIRNNIFYTPAAKVLNGPGSYKPFNFPHDHNLYYGGADPVGYPLGEGEKIADPRFVDFAARDLRLKAFSPAIDAGADLSIPTDFAGTLRPAGPRPDLGAYEYRGSKNPLLLIGGVTALLLLGAPITLLAMRRRGNHKGH